ncbi:MAG: hypothetical protein LBE27_08775 [Deltaproteobacteria bacterium]|jgi:hypothetical protein|nr:hypothetical protein [Deltaproteobacteria bacterium]
MSLSAQGSPLNIVFYPLKGKKENLFFALRDKFASRCIWKAYGELGALGKGLKMLSVSWWQWAGYYGEC